MAREKTFVLIKPDGVKRGISGKIISRFEEAGLKIVAMKMLSADEELAKKHYFLDEEWAKNVYEKSKKSYDKEGRKFPYKGHMHIGKTIQSWNCDFLCEGPIIAIVLQGPHAIEIVRKIVGSTEPRSSQPGTIRGDFVSIESYAVADENKRVMRNLVHASDSVENAKREISLWFSPNEIHENYKTATEMLLG
ncbi:nucleoside-diphosphate kinase [Candidatus Pacearchaeota archaeon]|nr:nucleoside-diphosphate kinase [Candidatus Pacearchaeota archaeon]